MMSKRASALIAYISPHLGPAVPTRWNKIPVGRFNSGPAMKTAPAAVPRPTQPSAQLVGTAWCAWLGGGYPRPPRRVPPGAFLQKAQKAKKATPMPARNNQGVSVHQNSWAQRPACD